MKNLFETFKASVYKPEFYRSVGETQFSSALRFYAKATFVLSIAMTIVFAIVIVPRGVRFIKEEAPELVKKYYPAELVITISKGKASSNVTEPYVVSAKDGMKKAFEDTRVENVFVVDTKNEFNKKKFDDYKTFALLTKEEMVTQGRRGQITIQELRGAPDMVISQAMLLAWVDEVSNSLGTFVPAGIAITFIIIMLGFALYLIPVLLFALVPFFYAWLRKIPLSYGNAYKMSLYAVVPGLALKALLNMSGVFSVPAYFTFLVFVLIVFINMQSEEQPRLFA